MGTEEDYRRTIIHAYWLSRGYEVDVHIGYFTASGHASHVVRSDMVNGLPRNLRLELPVDVAVPVVRDR